MPTIKVSQDTYQGLDILADLTGMSMARMLDEQQEEHGAHVQVLDNIIDVPADDFIGASVTDIQALRLVDQIRHRGRDVVESIRVLQARANPQGADVDEFDLTERSAIAHEPPSRWYRLRHPEV
jgi:hypothetical protein